MSATRILLVAAATALAAAAWPQDADGLLAEGNTLYERGDFAGAYAKYGESLAAGGGVGSLYNRGNACFRLGRLGEAIVHWERARRLAPRDADIRANLEHARDLCADEIEAPPRPFWVRMALACHNWLAADEAFVIAAAACWAACACLVLLLRGVDPRWRRHVARAGVLLAVVTLVATLSAALKLGEQRGRAAAVVTAAEVEVRSAPGEHFPQEFVLHEGTTLRIAQQRGLWYEVRLANGLDGWAPRHAITRL